MKHYDKYNKNFETFLHTPAELLQPGVTVECVILGFKEGKIRVLLNRYKKHSNWMLPGGFVRKTESVDKAAFRLLELRVGLENCYLQQFATFGDLDKSIINENKELLREYGIEDVDSHWMSNRFIDICYYAFINYDQARIVPTDDEECKWFNLGKLPSLFGNSEKIINKALRTLRMTVNYIPIGVEMLPEQFTMSELRVIYETILDRKLDRRNFQRQALSSGYVYKLEETSSKWGIKETALFSFDKEKCLKDLEYGYNIF